MGTSFKKKIRMLAMLLTVTLLLAGMRIPSMAASSVIDQDAGSLTIQPKYNNTVVSGCAFSIYKVADIDRNSAVLRYSMNSSFQGAGVDLNAAIGGTAVNQALEDAAGKLAAWSGKPAPAKSGAAGGTTISLPVGAYLVIQTSVPGNYTASSPFLIFLPYTNTGKEGTGGTEWVYDVAAYPKLGYIYSPPVYPPVYPPVVPPTVTTVKVVKKWDDAGNEAKRPSSVTVSLLQDGKPYASETLSGANGWQHTWSDLSAGSGWTVDESGVPDGYTSLIDSETEGDTCTFTITNTYGQIPLSGALFVSKVWNDKGYEKMRPSSVKAGLYCDGKLTETAVLNSGNDWSYAWAGLDDSKTWTVAEIDVADGYQSSIKQEGSAFTITNTYRKGGTPGGDTTDIGDGEVPHSGAPQTGLVQWPIPVLLIAGALLIILGLVLGRKKKHE